MQRIESCILSWTNTSDHGQNVSGSLHTSQHLKFSRHAVSSVQNTAFTCREARGRRTLQHIRVRRFLSWFILRGKAVEWDSKDACFLATSGLVGRCRWRHGIGVSGKRVPSRKDGCGVDSIQVFALQHIRDILASDVRIRTIPRSTAQ